VLNWVWLQFFVLGYMSEATTTARISLGVILFDISEAIFGKAQSSLMKHAEIERVGTKNAIFDRYHLKNLAFFAFACCEYCALVRASFCACILRSNIISLFPQTKWTADSAVFKKSLFIQINGWSEFVSFYLTNFMSYVVVFVWPMSNTMHNLDNKAVNKVFMQSSDVLNQRGILCFRAYLKNRASSSASFQYAAFIIFMKVLPYNSKVFVRFSDGAGFDARQQLLFVSIAWFLCVQLAAKLAWLRDICLTTHGDWLQRQYQLHNDEQVVCEPLCNDSTLRWSILSRAVPGHEKGAVLHYHAHHQRCIPGHGATRLNPLFGSQ